MKFSEFETSDADPTIRIIDQEFKTLFLCFCSLICILHNKKLNLANIFLLILKDEKILSLYKEICEFDTDFEAMKCFLEHDSALHKSKYIKKYLNSLNTTRAPR